jgi:hypothetical protein
MYPTNGINANASRKLPTVLFVEIRPGQTPGEIAARVGARHIDSAALSAKTGDILVFDQKNSKISLQ